MFWSLVGMFTRIFIFAMSEQITASRADEAMASKIAQTSPRATWGDFRPMTSVPKPISTPPPAKAEEQTITPIRAAQVVREYEANEVAADLNYKGKRLSLVGKVDRIAKDILDHPYVTLDSEEFGFRGVQVSFSDDIVPTLAQLQRGQMLGIVGTCKGLLMNVQISDARIVHQDWSER